MEQNLAEDREGWGRQPMCDFCDELLVLVTSFQYVMGPFWL